MTRSNDELRRLAAKRLASRLVRDHLGTRSPSGRSKENRQEPERQADEPRAARSQEPGRQERELSVCVVHGRQVARKVVSKALETKLGSPVHRYGSCEDALRYTKHYNTFVVYNNFGKRMNGAEGVTQIRAAKPEAFIIGVTSVPGFRHKFVSAGADDTVLLSGNEVAELAKRIKTRRADGQRQSGRGGS